MRELKILFNLILSELTEDAFFKDFKLRKRDSSLIRKTKLGKNIIMLDHWDGYHDGHDVMVVYPQYLVRYDILSKWFEKFSFKSLQDQRDGCYVGFSGEMLGSQDRFMFRYDRSNLMSELVRLKECIKRDGSEVFDAYSSLDKAYDRKIAPVLTGTTALPIIGADWFFENLTLCRIVHPEEYEKLKEIHLKHAEAMYGREEPNISKYYDRLSEILTYLENVELKS